MSICFLLIYWKKILGEPRILSFMIWIGGIRGEARIPTDWVEGWRRRQNSGILIRFCLLQRARAPGLEATVDKIQAFRSFFVYFEGARTDFGGYGRQNFGISLVLCLLRGPRKPISEAAVDKIQAFITIFVYFEAARAGFGGGGRQNSGISLVFVCFGRPCNQQQSKLCISQKKQPKKSTAL